MESELFGYEEGSFTGSRKGGKKGLLELANLLNTLILKYKKPVTISDEIYDIFRNYDWLGNIRELSNVLERMLVVCNRSKFEKADIPEYILNVSDVRTPSVYTEPFNMEHTSLNDVLEQTEKTKLLEVIANSRNRTEAIKKLGISRKTLYAKLKKYGII